MNANHEGEQQQHKLFVGGLSWETNEERLRRYFSDFGEVVECLVMKNIETGKSRGFGFVTFKEAQSVNHVLSVKGHQLDGRTIDPKECNPKNAARTRKEAKQGNAPKIFLGGLPANITETGLKDYFTKYGKVEVKRAEPQHMKSGTPGPNGHPHHHGHHGHHPNMGMPFYAMTPWGMWPAAPVMPPMNAPAINYQNQNAWNSTQAAAQMAAQMAAAAAASAVAPPNTWTGYPGYSPNGWQYAQAPAFQPPNSAANPQAAAAGSNGHSQPPPTGGPFLSPPGNVPSMNQNVPNNSANLPNAMIPRPGPNNFSAGAAAGAPFPGHNTHNNFGGPNSFGPGTPQPMPPPQGGPHHPPPPGNEGVAPPGMHQNSFNGNLPFGSRVAAQNQGYHPYRR